MKLLLENWRGYLNENVLETQVQYVLNTANAFLDELDSGHIDAIYLIGSTGSKSFSTKSLDISGSPPVSGFVAIVT